MCCDQVVFHVVGMRGREPDALEIVDLGQLADQPGQAPVAPVGTFAVIGIHVLAQQGDLAHAALDQVARLGQHPVELGRVLDAPGFHPIGRGHGGLIDCDSKDGRTTFTIRLPIWQPPQETR